MKLKDLSKEDLDVMSYGELAELILNENGSSMKIVDIFRKICSLLNMSEAEFENKVTDFFELITTDKEFIVLEKGFCDLRKKHTPKLIIEEDEDDVVENDINEEDIEETESEDTEDDIFYDNSSDEDDVEDSDDDLNDFIVVDEEEASI